MKTCNLKGKCQPLRLPRCAGCRYPFAPGVVQRTRRVSRMRRLARWCSAMELLRCMAYMIGALSSMALFFLLLGYLGRHV